MNCALRGEQKVDSSSNNKYVQSENTVTEVFVPTIIKMIR
uniref:Uncharacterized protein n=1 Tax=Anguilla anguilla TaxID=7936 RepID=A0A0E9V6L0_ANGAN